MPVEPTTAAGATLASTVAAVPIVTAFGVPLGLRPDVLVAGLSGAIVAIVLLNAVPASGDTWSELVRTTTRRIAVALASSLTAGYLTPLVLVMGNLPEPVVVGAAFGVGAGAQRVLAAVIRRLSGAPSPAGAGEGGQ